MANLKRQFPLGEYKSWRKCQLLYPHAKSAIAHQPHEEDSVQEWTSILYCAAWYALDKGYVADAEQFAVMAREADTKLLGPEHNKTLNSVAMVALVYKLRGRWKEAEELQLQVMELSKKVLGEEHPNTLNSINNLAMTYSNRGRWEEAEELQLQVMETWKRVLGEEHPNTLTSISNLALTYSDQGRLEEAEELQLQVM